MSYRSLFALCALTLPLSAQDGGQLFTLYCSACHGADGKGAANGTFPPLAMSPYVAGEPDRAIKIILHGLAGPMTVLGKTYNLEMPPQGAMMPDDQIAAVLTYVRTSWGNKETPVSADLVKKIRAETANRTEHWTAPELLKLHPIKEAKPLTDLLSYTYSGNWQNAPDFSKFKPTATEEEPSGKIALPKIKGKKAKAKANSKENSGENLGMVWEGTLTLPSEGDYDFMLAADDGGRILLDGKLLTEITGSGPLKGRAKETTVKASAGAHKFRTEYYDVAGEKGIQVAWRQKGQKEWNFLTEDAKAAKAWPPIILTPRDRPIIYRNFIEKTSPRAMGVGFPGGVNLAYSIDNLAPELIWTGAFIDAGHHWTDRGIGNEPPAGQKVVKLTSSPTLNKAAQFKGYKLDPAGNPSILVQFGELSLLDAYSASSPATLIRQLQVTGKASGAENLTLVDGIAVKASGTDSFTVGENLTITAKSAKIVGSQLVLPLVPGSSTEIRYIWK
jgi:mono/diheme cytochrome c family protein